MAQFFKAVGKTPEGRYCLSGVYRIFETSGLPLDMIVKYLWEHGLVPSWSHFYQEAAQAGVKHRSIISRIEESVSLLRRLNQVARPLPILRDHSRLSRVHVNNVSYLNGEYVLQIIDENGDEAGTVLWETWVNSGGWKEARELIQWP